MISPTLRAPLCGPSVPRETIAKLIETGKIFAHKKNPHRIGILTGSCNIQVYALRPNTPDPPNFRRLASFLYVAHSNFAVDLVEFLVPLPKKKVYLLSCEWNPSSISLLLALSPMIIPVENFHVEDWGKSQEGCSDTPII